MSEPIVVKTEGTRTVKVYHDDYNPREGSDLFGEILYLNTSRYKLGDRAVSKEEMNRIAKSKEYIHLPVYAYVHSGVSISTFNSYPYNDRFDGGRSGIVYVSKEAARKELSVQRFRAAALERVYSLLRSEVDECARILEGNVYRYVVEEDGAEIDSCGGVIGVDADKIASQALVRIGHA